MALNQRVGGPYGDIFTVSTPAVDRQLAILHAEEQRKRAEQDKAIQDLDNEFSKNMYNIRDVDAGDVAKAYGEYKTIAQDLIRRKGQVKPEDQYKLLQAKANVYGLINKSKTQRESEKLYAGEVAKKPNKYVRDAHGKLISVMNTPVSKIGDNDPFADLPYKGNMNSFNKLLGDAVGKEIKLDDEITDNQKELRKDVTHVSRLNNAKEYYDKLVSGVVGSQGADDFVRTFDVSDDQYNNVKRQYEQKMADPIIRKRLGMDKIDLPPDEGLTEVQKAAKFLAMQYQVMTNPIIKEGTPVYSNVALSDKKRKEGMEDWRIKNKITFGQSMAKIAANKAAKTPPEDTGYLSDNVADEVGETQTIRFGNGKSEKRVIYVDNIDPERLNIISGRDLSKKQIGVEPIAIKQPDGSVKMGYYQDLGTGDWEGKGGQKISRERVKDDYIKTVSPSKFKDQAGTKASENTKNPKVKKTTKSGLPVFH